MAKKSMKEIRALARKKMEGNGNRKRNYNSDVYPFWEMKEGEVATVRLLPDKNTDNDFPFVERHDHWITIDGKKRRITSPKTWDESARCPFAELSAQYYDAGDEENGKYYYRNITHLAKALVLDDPLPPNAETGEKYTGKVVTLQLGYQLHTKFMEDLGNVFDDDDPLPWSLEEGFNFNLKKTVDGKGRAKWDASSYFDRKPSQIPEEYLENIELVDLRELLGEPTTYDEVNELLAQHLNGSPDRDEDSLKSKKGSSGSSSKRAELLARLKSKSDDEGEDEDNTPDSEADSDDDNFEDVPDFDDTDDQAKQEESSPDDNDDNLDSLKSLIKNRKKS